MEGAPKLMGPTSVCQALGWPRIRVSNIIIGIPWAFLHGGNREQTGSNSLLSPCLQKAAKPLQSCQIARNRSAHRPVDTETCLKIREITAGFSDFQVQKTGDNCGEVTSSAVMPAAKWVLLEASPHLLRAARPGVGSREGGQAP